MDSRVVCLVAVFMFACLQMAQCDLDPVCLQPKKVGPCRASKPRYYYDSKKGGCEFFIYGGCHENGNNFMTVEDCQTKCPDESYKLNISTKRKRKERELADRWTRFSQLLIGCTNATARRQPSWVVLVHAVLL